MWLINRCYTVAFTGLLFSISCQISKYDYLSSDVHTRTTQVRILPQLVNNIITCFQATKIREYKLAVERKQKEKEIKERIKRVKKAKKKQEKARKAQEKREQVYIRIFSRFISTVERSDLASPFPTERLGIGIDLVLFSKVNNLSAISQSPHGVDTSCLDSLSFIIMSNVGHGKLFSSHRFDGSRNSNQLTAVTERYFVVKRMKFALFVIKSHRY